MSGAGAPIDVRLPDGSVRTAPSGTTVLEMLRGWRKEEAKGYLAALWNGTPVDLSRALTTSGQLTPLTFQDAAGREILQHSAAHLVAKALVALIPTALPTVGPATEEGFYYDFDVRPLVPEDLDAIHARISEAVKKREPFERIEVSRDEAMRMVEGNRHKQGYIADTPPGEPISFYRTGEFVDLCRGPHVPDTHWLEGTHILGFSAITAGGKPDGEPLQRVRGVAFPTAHELDAYLKQRREAEARDHRVLGPKLELFTFLEEVPGFPVWLPNGMVVVRELERFVREHLEAAGYSEIRSPLLFPQTVYETSGHWEHYRENMFLVSAEDRVYGLKPMNCPGSMLIFRSRARSYRELPLRLAEFAPLHRLEASGTLHGLTRAREFVQDDAHLFVTEEQVEPEVKVLMQWIRDAFTTLRLSWSYELSTRPTQFLGDPGTWDRAEAILEKVLQESGVEFKISAGEGAFYGPKIDIHVRDSLGRPWQCGTIQLDYQMPRRFGLQYQGADGQLHTPIVIHRVILGTWERFTGVLLEHCNGRLPPWLSPTQVRVLPVAERHEAASAALVAELKGAGFRATSTGSQETLSKRVREAEVDRIPYVVVIGDAEVASGNVAVRTRGEKGQKSLAREAFVDLVGEKVRTRSFDA